MKRRYLWAVAALAFLSAAGPSPAPVKPGQAPAEPPHNPLESSTTAQNEGTGSPVPARNDTELLRGLTSALLDDPSAPAIRALTIAVKDGRATLRGVARSASDKEAAARKAGTVPGLLGLDNLILVAP